jgi:hypothetical protein
LTTSPSPGGTVGAAYVKDTAGLTGGYQPTGTITFTLYANTTCSGPAADVETAPVSGNGDYTTPTGVTPAAAGTYEWTARYGGDLHNSPAASGCGSEQVTVTPASPTLSTSTTALALLGSTVTDTATLTGGDHPTGTIGFALYTTANCSGQPASTATVTVTGDGSYGPPTGFTPTAAGAYQWTAVYSGDANNAATTTVCGSEPVTISTCLVVDTTNGQAFARLQDAVNAAAAADVLTVQGGCTGITTIPQNLTVTGLPATGYPTPTLDGSGNGSVLTVSQGAAVTINALTVTGGVASSCCGGGISNSGTLTLNTVTVTGNTTLSGTGGGGIGNFGSLTLSSSTVSGNTVANGGGAGIWTVGTLILNGNTGVRGNTGANQGGGIGAFGGAVTLDVTATVSGNSAGAGGGVFAGSTLVTLNGLSSVTDNTAAGDGGGIWTNLLLTLNDGGSVTANTAGGRGGGIFSSGMLAGASAGIGGDVFGNSPDDIYPPAVPTLATSSAIAVPLGTIATDTATLTGGYHPSGTIKFMLYAAGGCSGSPVDTEVVTIAGAGTYTTPTGYVPTAAGIYEWTATYSGDPNNLGASTVCGSEPVTVVGVG